MRVLILLLCAGIVWADLRPTTRELTGERIEGAALLASDRIVTWGDRLREWTLPALQSRVLAEGPFGEGACVGASGEVYTVLGRGLGKLVRMAPPSWNPEVLDTEVEMHDCLEATLFGRRGLLMIQRGVQVRFYDRGRTRDIYSIYTPSYQGGLALGDVDGDGFTDIYCGNYWIQSPRKWEHSWRLFAINTWSEEEQSANFELAVLGPGRIAVAQRKMNSASVAVFDKPPDPKQQWPLKLLEDGAYVQGLAVWNGDLIWGENNGADSRLFSQSRGVLHRGVPVVSIVPVSKDVLVTAGPRGLTLWEQHP